MAMMKQHVCLTWDELQRALGVEGEVRKVWVEPDGDYVHVMLEWTSQRPAPDGYRLVVKGGYTEITLAPCQRQRET